MESLLRIGLSNAVVATGLALAAACIGRCCRRPALVHSLWLLVLLKLVTPPLHTIAVPWPVRETPAARAELPEEIRTTPVAEAPVSDAPLAVPDVLMPAEWVAAPPEVELPPEAEPATSWQQLVSIVWLTGAGVWWLLAAVRLTHFRRCLRFARLAPRAVQEQARELAARLGLARCPSVWFMPAPVSPMLWALFGTPRLLAPTALWDKLSKDETDTLLTHELAHLRRRDHWIRWLELFVLGLYWWHPVVWWARRELREVEEQCCDAWVVWALPTAAPAYASALVETVAFLSQSRRALPLSASGVGHISRLQRRLTMIMRGTTPRALSCAGWLAVVGIGALMLPLLPTWAQVSPPAVVVVDEYDQPPVTPPAQAQEPPSAPADRELLIQKYYRQVADEKVRARAAEVLARYPDQPSTTVGGAPPRAEKDLQRARPGVSEALENASDEVELLEAQLHAKQARLTLAGQAVERAQRRLKPIQDLYKQGVVDHSKVEEAQQEVEALKLQYQVEQAELQEPSVRLKQAQWRLSRLKEQMGSSRPATTTGTSAPRPGSTTVGPTGAIRTTPPMTRVPPTPATTATWGTPAATPVPARPADTRTPEQVREWQSQLIDAGVKAVAAQPKDPRQRMSELDQRLNALLREVEALRQEMRQTAPDTKPERIR